MTLGGGQQDDPAAIQVDRHAILQPLALLGISSLPLLPVQAEREILRLVDVTDREHAGDTFSREWRSFDTVKTSQVIGVRYSGEEIKATADGFVVFPNPGAQVGQEWFYLAERRA